MALRLAAMQYETRYKFHTLLFYARKEWSQMREAAVEWTVPEV